MSETEAARRQGGPFMAAIGGPEPAARGFES